MIVALWLRLATDRLYSQMTTDLIYDVGMHNGDDTAYYLSKGYRVLAIEANPILVAAAEDRFSAEIEEGRVEIISAAIARRRERAKFWVNCTNSVQSSFSREMALRWGGEVQVIDVECVPFTEILQKHGVPYYMKIDIEGADSDCLAALSPDDLPVYVSAEAHSLMPLCQLASLGYTDFKCVYQRDHNRPAAGLNSTPTTTRFVREAIRLVKQDIRRRLSENRIARSVWQFSKSSGQAIVRTSATTTAKQGNRDASRNACNGKGSLSVETENGQRMFPLGCSGPFGEETAGEWLPYDDIAYEWLHLHKGHPQLSSLAVGSWYDFHARRSGS